MDGSPQVVRFDATTLWHFDAAEWAPSTASKQASTLLRTETIQRPIAKYVGIALAALRKVDDSRGDNCVGMIAPLSLKGYASHSNAIPMTRLVSLI